MRKLSFAILTLSFLLAACGAKTTPSMQPTTVATVTPNAATPTPAKTPVTTPVPTPTPEQGNVSKQYHMNKVYDIVPNDPGTNKKVVLLTFDDGPKEKEMIDSIIATLDKHKAKAIFFMNGYRIKAHPELLKDIHDKGQVLGNHSWDHIQLNKVTNAKIDQQIDDVNAIIKEMTGETAHFFRPPFGLGNDYLKSKIKDEGLLYMTWSNGSLDWEMTNAKNNPDKVIENVIKQLHAGSNILMHELPWTVQALDKLLTQLEEKGYSFVDPNSIELIAR
jgi:peptidoglycan-N-acetylglucosamine deacetylase